MDAMHLLFYRQRGLFFYTPRRQCHDCLITLALLLQGFPALGSTKHATRPSTLLFAF